MKQKRFAVEQIVAVLKQAEAGVPLVELIRRVGISEQAFYRWKKQYVGLEVNQVRQLKISPDVFRGKQSLTHGVWLLSDLIASHGLLAPKLPLPL